MRRFHHNLRLERLFHRGDVEVPPGYPLFVLRLRLQFLDGVQGVRPSRLNLLPLGKLGQICQQVLPQLRDIPRASKERHVQQRDRGRPRFGVLLQTLEHDFADMTRKLLLGGVRGEGWRGLVEGHQQDFDWWVFREGRVSERELQKRDSKRPDVRVLVVPRPVHHFGGHPTGGPHKRGAELVVFGPRAAAFDGGGHAEIGKAYGTVGIDEDIASLDLGGKRWSAPRT